MTNDELLEAWSTICGCLAWSRLDYPRAETEMVFEAIRYYVIYHRGK